MTWRCGGLWLNSQGYCNVGCCLLQKCRENLFLPWCAIFFPQDLLSGSPSHTHTQSPSPHPTLCPKHYWPLSTMPFSWRSRAFSLGRPTASPSPSLTHPLLHWLSYQQWGAETRWQNDRALGFLAIVAHTKLPLWGPCASQRPHYHRALSLLFGWNPWQNQTFFKEVACTLQSTFMHMMYPYNPHLCIWRVYRYLATIKWFEADLLLWFYIPRRYGNQPTKVLLHSRIPDNFLDMNAFVKGLYLPSVASELWLGHHTSVKCDNSLSSPVPFGRTRDGHLALVRGTVWPCV